MQGYLSIVIMPTQWKTATGSIKFDTLDKNGAISLNDMVYNPDSIPELSFKFTGNGQTTLRNFKIIQEGTQWYLIRNTVLQNGISVVDAKDIGDEILPVSECLNSTTCVKEDLKIAVLPNPDISFRMNPNKRDQLLSTVLGTPASIPLLDNNPVNSFLQTVAADGNTLITGDTITMDQGLENPIVKNTQNNNSTIAYYEPIPAVL